MRQQYLKYKALLPVFVLMLFCITTFFDWIRQEGEYEGFALTLKHYAGFSMVVASLISFFSFKPYYKYVLSLTLLFGLINLINFTAAEIFFSVGLGDLKLGVQPVSFLVCLLTYMMYFSRANIFLIRHLGPSQEQIERNWQESRAEQVDKFKRRYYEYSDEMLKAILTEKKFVSEALDAARLILDERSAKGESVS